jgi:hypothetical protein
VHNEAGGAGAASLSRAIFPIFKLVRSLVQLTTQILQQLGNPSIADSLASRKHSSELVASEVPQYDRALPERFISPPHFWHL